MVRQGIIFDRMIKIHVELEGRLKNGGKIESITITRVRQEKLEAGPPVSKMDASTYDLVISDNVAIQIMNYFPGVGTGGIIYPRTQLVESVCDVLYVVRYLCRNWGWMLPRTIRYHGL